MDPDMEGQISDAQMEAVLARGKTGHRFTNWATTYSCFPELFFEPSSTEQIREILITAMKLHQRVRVCGAGHSPSDLVCTSGYLIDLKRYKAVLAIDQEKYQVTVQGGSTLTELHDVLDSHGLGFSNLGAISDLSSAGTISTCTHGTGANNGILATDVVSLELMTASGEVIDCSRTKNTEIFLSALCGVGALGIILSITWQCEPAFKLHQIKKSFSLDKMLENMEEGLHSCEHFKFFWYPHTDRVLAEYVNQTNEAPTETKSSWFWDLFIGFYLLECLYWISSIFPGLIPFINHLYYNLNFKNNQEKIDKSYKVFNFNCLFKQYVTEWAIPRDKAAYVLRKLRKWTETSGYKAHFPVECRFVKADDIYLSPCYQQDMCFINIICYRPFNKYVAHDSYWDYFEKLMGSVGGKPHWAKAHKVTAAKFAQLYPKFNKFKEICEKLDPTGMFRNENLERTIFG